jgi:hypothetical protein
MKTNKSIQTLCSLLSECRTDLGDLALHSNGDKKYFDAQLRSVALDYAKLMIPEVSHLPAPLPESTGQFIFKKADQKNELRGYNVSLKTPQHFFTTLDGFVTAEGMPTLVEMCNSPAEKLDNYFMDYPRKRAVMETLFGEDYGWVIMLPSDYFGEEQEPLPTFKKLGGHVSVLSYTASEMVRYVELYKKGADTRMLVKQ